ncbi:MAG: DUF4129 domain-containing protein [Oscillospiraceae bacterium]|nr:DUF4129 domain-containing protein [Oscillospiraceae bacterium]
MMKRTAAVRLSADICFVFAFISVFPLFSRWVPAMAIYTALALIVGLFAAGIKNAALRTLISVLPAIVFIFSPLELPIIAPILGAVYFSINMAVGNFILPLYEYRRSFRIMLVLSLIVFAVNIANSTIFRDNVVSVPSLAFAVAFILLGIVSMRRMQMGASMDLRWHLTNAATVIGIPVAAIGGAVILFFLLRSSAKVLNFIFYPIGRFFIWLFYKLFSRDNLPVEDSELLEYITPHTPTFEMEVPLEGERRTGVLEDNPFFSNLLIERATTIGAYVILALLIIAAIWFIVKLAKRGADEAEDELYYEETSSEKPGKRRRRRARAPLGNALQIRRIYRVWLDYLQGKGIEIDKSDTSRDVLNSAEAVNERPEASRLRELYIAARYGDPDSITRENVAEAKACLDALTGE